MLTFPVGDYPVGDIGRIAERRGFQSVCCRRFGLHRLSRCGLAQSVGSFWTAADATGDLALSKRRKWAILATSSSESGECRLNMPNMLALPGRQGGVWPLPDTKIGEE